MKRTFFVSSSSIFQAYLPVGNVRLSKISLGCSSEKNSSANVESGLKTIKADRSLPSAALTRIPFSKRRIQSFCTSLHVYPAEARQPCSSRSFPTACGYGDSATVCSFSRYVFVSRYYMFKIACKP